jgi:predicted RNA-binding protein with RPS1 domain
MAMSTAWFTCPTWTGTCPGEQAIETYNKGDIVQAQVLDVDTDKERISLGIKQLGRDAVGDAAASGDLRKGAVVTAEVTAVNDGGLEVKLVDHDVEAFIRRSDLSRDRDEQRPERFSVGQKVDARITQFDKKTRRISLSIKALEIAEEKEAVAQFGSTDAGASLGDILGAALKKAPAVPMTYPHYPAIFSPPSTSRAIIVALPSPDGSSTCRSRREEGLRGLAVTCGGTMEEAVHRRVPLAAGSPHRMIGQASHRTNPRPLCPASAGRLSG